MENVILVKSSTNDFDFKYILESDDSKEYTIDFDNKLIIFDFWNEGCVHCEPQELILKNLKEKYIDLFEVFKLNVDFSLNYDFAKTLKLRLLPSLLIMNKKTKKRFLFNGLTPKEDIEYFLENNTDKLCINCKNLDSLVLWSKSPNFYYCKMLKTYVYFKDSCQ